MKYPYSTYTAALPGYGTSLVDRINLYLHFRRYLKILTERWLLIAICTVLGLGISLFQAFNKPDIYRAQSVLQVTPKVNVGIVGAAQIEEDARMAENQITMMKSGAVILRVMAKLQEGSGSTNKLIRPTYEAFAGRGNTYVMEAKGTNLDLCQRFVTAWAEEFIDYKKGQRVLIKRSAEAATQREILNFERELTTAQEDLEQFKRQWNITDFKDAGARARERLESAKNAYFQLVTRRKLWENATREDLATRGVSDPAAEGAAGKANRSERDREEDAIRTQSYANLRFEIRKAEAIYQEKQAALRTNHPFMRDLSRTIALRYKELEEVLNMIDEARLAQVRSLKTEEDSYPELMEEIENEVLEKNTLETEFASRLKKEFNIKEQLDNLQRQLTSMGRISTDDEQFTILARGEGEPTPIAPDRPAIVMAGVGLGFFIGLGLMFLLHKLDDRLDNPEHIEEELEEPILGQLPEVDKKHFKEGYLLLTRMKSHTMFAESLRGIRSALLLSPEGTAKRLLAVTSSVPGDGKTTFTTNFAVTVANSGNRTLLVDADLRRGNVHGYFEQPLEGGLAEVLEGTLPLSKAIHETPVKNLFFMRAGKRPSNPSELLIGPGTKDLIMELRRQFDYVIFDCPPLTAIDDTFSIAAYLDGLFFVVRAGKTSMRFAKMGINTIHQRGAPILGLIINGVPIDNPYYYYTTYYYASYYHRPLSPDENAFPDRRGVLPDAAVQPSAGRKDDAPQG
jgi:capsular exopolysaccharide synthesis family protein